MSLICDAIRTHTLLEFDYHGQHRVVAPYAHGISARGVEVFRGIQLGGESSSRGYGFGKLWVVADLVDLRLAGPRFEPYDPHYNPDDRALQHIHCRVERPTLSARTSSAGARTSPPHRAGPPRRSARRSRAGEAGR